MTTAAAACRPRTATSMASRLRSNPTATRRGMASSLWLTSACTSTRKQRVPSTATCTRGAGGRRRVAAGTARRGRRTGLQAGLAHLEDAELVGGAEAVLGGAQHAVEAVAVALELQHRVDHVLEHPGAGDGALLGHVPDEEDGRAGVLGQAQEAARRLAHLAHAARRRGEGVAVERLHGVDDDQRRARRPRPPRGRAPARSRRGRRCRRAARRCARRAS